MSTAIDAVEARCNELGAENRLLEIENEHLSCKLADALEILSRFQDSARDKLRHYDLCRTRSGKYDAKKLRSG